MAGTVEGGCWTFKLGVRAHMFCCMAGTVEGGCWAFKLGVRCFVAWREPLLLSWVCIVAWLCFCRTRNIRGCMNALGRSTRINNKHSLSSSSPSIMLVSTLLFMDYTAEHGARFLSYVAPALFSFARAAQIIQHTRDLICVCIV